MGVLARQPNAGELLRRGACIQLECGPGELGRQLLEEAGRPAPPSTAVEAMIDTGTYLTILDEELVDELSLTAIGSSGMYIPVPGGWLPAALYEAQLRFPEVGGVTCQTLVLGMNLVDFRPTRCLVGRQELTRAVFAYIRSINAFSLSL